MERANHVENITRISPGTAEIAPGLKMRSWIRGYLEKVTPGSTSWHEAYHAGVALLRRVGVKLASRIPGPWYQGITELTEFDGPAAMAAGAMGCSGARYDKDLTERMGHDSGSAAATARSTVSGNEHKIRAIAAEIEVNGTISGYQAEVAMDRADHPDADLEFEDPVGSIRHFVVRTRRITNNGYEITDGLPDLELPIAA